MYFIKKSHWLLLILALLFLLSITACGGEKQEPTPTVVNMDTVNTQIAAQVFAGLTETAVARPPTQEAAISPTMSSESEANSGGIPTIASLPTLDPGDTTQVSNAATPIEISTQTGGDATSKCKYRAQLNYESPKDGGWVQSDKPFTRVWSFTNTGDCEWPAKTVLRCVGGELFGADGTDVITEKAIPPGEHLKVERRLKVPKLKGGLREMPMQGFYMIGTPDGRLFGSGADGKGQFWIRIIVCEEKRCWEIDHGVTPTPKRKK